MATAKKKVSKKVTKKPAKEVAFDLKSLTKKNMLGGVVKAMLDEVKQAPDQWHKMKEFKQEELINRLESKAEEIIERCVDIVNSTGYPYYPASIGPVTFNPDGKVKFSLVGHDAENAHKLAKRDAGVVIVLCDYESFKGGDMPQAMPQQTDLVK